MTIENSDLVFYLVHLCAVAAGCLYGVASVRFLRAIVSDSKTLHQLALRDLVWATALHSVFIFEQLLGFVLPVEFGEILLPSSAFSVSFVGWILAAGFLLARGRLPLEGLGVFVSPISMLLILSSAFWFHIERSVVPLQNSPLLAVHIACSLIGHVAFVAAFVVSLALIVQENLLKKKSFALVIRSFPPLRVLDSLNTALLCVGVCAMSLGVLLGAAFAYKNGSVELLLSSRALWSLGTLFLYGALVSAIFIRGFRGRRAAWGSVIGYAVILCSFVSTRLLGAVFHVH